MTGPIDRRRMIGAAAAGALVAASAGAAAAKVSLRGLTKALSRPSGGAGPVVGTRYGKVQGIDEGTVKVFRGVPYGASTGGAARFRAPEKPAAWKGVRAATANGPISPQPNFPVIPEEAGSQPVNATQGEDCLVLNVWTAGLDAAGKRPVMVWFHGGGYAVGAGASPWYEGANLAKKQGVVVVTVNHRLNVFGFLHLEEAMGPAYAGSGNAGMLDCVAALEWVRDNISNFGGDPGRVTIFGESGGAGKVSTLMAMPAAKGLFHRAIAQSGAALKHIPAAQAAATARRVLDQLGVAPGDTAALAAKTPDEILKAVAAVKQANFGPVVDGTALPRHPFDPTAPAVSADVPFMVGSNLTETTFFPNTPLDPLDDKALADQVKAYTRTGDGEAAALIALYRGLHPGKSNVMLYQLISTDYWMRDQVLLQAERKAALGPAPAYVYQFNKLSPARGGKLHCPHGSEIPYAFDNLAAAPELTSGPGAQALADRMSAAWAAFARNGNPDADTLPHWPAYEGDERAVMVFDDECRVELDPGSRERVAIAELKATQA